VVRTALCLSGGGFRAALFHLGVVRRLHEVRVLPSLDYIVGVSGGSILAGFLAAATRNPKVSMFPDFVLSTKDWQEKIDMPFHDLTSRNLRLRYFLRWAHHPRPVREAQQEAFVDTIHLAIGDLRLGDLPTIKPSYIFAATDVGSGTAAYFDRSGQSERGNQSRPILHMDSTPIALAVAASSAFPIVAGPIRVRTDPTRNESAQLLLADGGLVDNLGIDLFEPGGEGLEADYMIVSDAGGLENGLWNKSTIPVVAGLKGCLDVMDHRSRERQRRLVRKWTGSGDTVACLISTEDAGRWTAEDALFKTLRLGQSKLRTLQSMNEAIADQMAGGSKQGLIDGADLEHLLAAVRTDIDGFSFIEGAMLENAGYAACTAKLEEAADGGGTPPGYAWKEPLLPHPRWTASSGLAAWQALQRSNQTYAFGRYPRRRWRSTKVEAVATRFTTPIAALVERHGIIGPR
jgi:NTE family protein